MSPLVLKLHAVLEGRKHSEILVNLDQQTKKTK